VATEREVLTVVIEESGFHCRVCSWWSDTQQREIEVDMLPANLRQSILLLQEAILRSPGARRADVPIRKRDSSVQRQVSPDAKATPLLRDTTTTFTTGADERMVQEIGSQLFEFIFQRGVLELYRECYRNAKEVLDRPLLIRLCIKHPELSWVPWETLYDKSNGFYVTTSQYTPFSRSINADVDHRSITSGRPIRILGMAARVKTLNGIALDSIEVDAEQVTIKKALGRLDDGQKIKLCWIPSAKARDLNRRLSAGDDGKRWDIFHFIGHGGHDNNRGMGYIVVQEDGGSKGARLYAQDLRNFLIQPGRTPSLVVLNSCSGAQAQPGELFSSTAADLIHGGVPAVIAMQFEISDNMGIAFSDAFYTYLADNVPIEQAMAHTRADLKASGFGEWISPVLFMRTADGGFFMDIAAPSSAADPASPWP
jgi:CHAT domain